MVDTMVISAPTRPSYRTHTLSRLKPECRLLIQLLEMGVVTPPAADCTPASFVEWCRRNKLPLMGLADDLPTWLRGDDTLASALAAETSWYETQRSEYEIARNAWLNRSVPCLMIKSAGNAPSFPHTSDNIDILFRPEDGVAARDTLRQLGYNELRNVEEPGKFLFRKFQGGACVSAIHVHEWIAWFVGFLDDRAVWQRIRPADDDPIVNIPAPEDAMLINLAHACYENKVFRLNDMIRVHHALRTTSPALDWHYMERVAGMRGWRDGLAFMLLVHAEAEVALFGETLIPTEQIAHLEGLIRDDKPVWQRLSEIRAAGIDDLPLDLSYPFCKRLYYRKILHDSARDARERWRDVATTLLWGVRLKSGIRPQPGLAISLSGPDGSGKTAHAQVLVDALRLCEIRADYVWSRGGSTGLLGVASRVRHQLRRTPRTVSPPTTEMDAVARRQQQLSNPIAQFVWAWLVAVDQVGTAFWHVRLPALRGRVIVTDRFVHDTAVEMDVSLPQTARWSRLAIGAMLRCSPRGDLGYVLDVSLDSARGRKPFEVWHSSFEDQRARYGALAERFGLRVISTEGPFAESNDELLHEILTTFMAAYETRLNALFLANPGQKNVPDAIWTRPRARTQAHGGV